MRYGTKSACTAGRIANGGMMRNLTWVFFYLVVVFMSTPSFVEAGEDMTFQKQILDLARISNDILIKNEICKTPNDCTKRRLFLSVRESLALE